MGVQAAKLTNKQIADEKSARLMNGVAYWGAYYRENPHRFCKEYLNVKLYLFQKILIYAMMHNDHFMFCASRGIGKTWLTALFCVVRCILYPGTQIVVASVTRPQGNLVLLKIEELFRKQYGWGSELLNREILKSSVGANSAYIEFRNGSYIKVATASDSGRGLRANILIVDEFRLVDLNIINTVLKKFLIAKRMPGYASKDEYKHIEEANIEIYMSSCWYKSHWSYEKARSFTASFMNPNVKYFICGLPYQIAIKEGFLPRKQVEEEMQESDFDEITFDIEMGCIWYGDTGDSFFSFADLSSRRKIKTAFYPPGDKYKVPDLAIDERRILSVDVALMASTAKKNNDAASIIVNSCIPASNNNYISNMVYYENHEGMTTDELGIRVMKLFYEMKCTDIALDCNGNGLGVYDFIIKDQMDPDTMKPLKALTSCNNKDMAARCKVPDAAPVVWCIKGSASFNNDMCRLLRSGFKSGKINLLIPEFDAEEYLASKFKGYSKMDAYSKTEKKMPYIQTTLLVYELIKLNRKIKGTNIKIEEKSGERKDRYSSIGYNYWVAHEIEVNQEPEQVIDVHKYTAMSRRPSMVARR